MKSKKESRVNKEKIMNRHKNSKTLVTEEDQNQQGKGNRPALKQEIDPKSRM